ncbi:MAG: hypothetical protein L0H84_20825 [Pseudonocardia sp.]|nr:hypothetical protein [Pseudonocardia sp.]
MAGWMRAVVVGTVVVAAVVVVAVPGAVAPTAQRPAAAAGPTPPTSAPPEPPPGRNPTAPRTPSPNPPPDRPLPQPGVPPGLDLAPLPFPQQFPGAQPGAPWVVSLGDSFISGEAGRWAGNTDKDSSRTDALGATAYFDSPDGTRELIPLCHRSKSAMIHIVDDGSPDQPGAPVNSLNLACSGAQTVTMTSSGAFKPGLDFFNADPAHQGQALMLQEFAAAHDVRLVEVSIGGNDFAFAPIVTACVEDYLVYDSLCSKQAGVLAEVNADAVTRVTANITTALQNVRTAMRNAGKADGSWTLVFNLNPDPLANGGDFRYPQNYNRQLVGGCGFWDADATWASTELISIIRKAQLDAIARAGITPTHILDLGELLDARELCVRGTELVGTSRGAKTWKSPDAVDVSEWANQIHLQTVTGPYFQQESLHPNYWGQLAARSCVRQIYAAGDVRSGTCVRAGSGLTGRGEPAMTLANQAPLP